MTKFNLLFVSVIFLLVSSCHSSKDKSEKPKDENVILTAAHTFIDTTVMKDYGIVAAGYKICSDGKGMFYIAGTFFNAFPNGTGEVKSVGEDDNILVKIDTLGNIVWAKSFPSSGRADWGDVVCDNDGNVYTTVNYYGDLTIGAKKYSGAKDDYQSCCVKLDADGNILWSRQFRSKSITGSLCIFKSLDADAKGHILLAGSFAGNEMNCTDDRSLDIVIDSTKALGGICLFQLNTDGSLYKKLIYPSFRASRIGTKIGENTVQALYANADSIVLVYSYGSESRIGPYHFLITGNSIVVAKIVDDGKVAWAKTAGGILSNLTANAFDINDEGLIVLGGNYYSPFYWDTDSFTSPGYRPEVSSAFILSLDANGKSIASNYIRTTRKTTGFPYVHLFGLTTYGNKIITVGDCNDSCTSNGANFSLQNGIISLHPAHTSIFNDAGAWRWYENIDVGTGGKAILFDAVCYKNYYYAVGEGDYLISKGGKTISPNDGMIIFRYRKY